MEWSLLCIHIIRNMIGRQVIMFSWENHPFCKYSFCWKWHTFLSDKNQCHSQKHLLIMHSWSLLMIFHQGLFNLWWLLLEVSNGHSYLQVLSTWTATFHVNLCTFPNWLSHVTLMHCYSPFSCSTIKKPSSCCNGIIDLKYIQLNSRLSHC